MNTAHKIITASTALTLVLTACADRHPQGGQQPIINPLIPAIPLPFRPSNDTVVQWRSHARTVTRTLGGAEEVTEVGEIVCTSSVAAPEATSRVAHPGRRPAQPARVTAALPAAANTNEYATLDRRTVVDLTPQAVETLSWAFVQTYQGQGPGSGAGWTLIPRLGMCGMFAGITAARSAYDAAVLADNVDANSVSQIITSVGRVGRFTFGIDWNLGGPESETNNNNILQGGQQTQTGGTQTVRTGDAIIRTGDTTVGTDVHNENGLGVGMYQTNNNGGERGHGCDHGCNKVSADYGAVAVEATSNNSPTTPHTRALVRKHLERLVDVAVTTIVQKHYGLQ